jgi:hypothetical protein
VDIPTNITVNEDTRGGFDLSNTSIAFGSQLRGGESKRWIHISYTKDTIVNFKIFGDIESFIYISENDFFLAANTTRTIYFTAKVPADAEPGTYVGTLRMTFKKP